MKRTLIAAALLVSFPLCYAQTSSGGAAPITGAQNPPGMPSNPIGNSSITLSQTIFAADERAADVRSVVVYFDYQNNKSRELTSEMRSALAPFVTSH